ncbi:MAG: ergothioneine biosynthesis protein EgtB [Bradymonadaceae bacterium]
MDDWSVDRSELLDRFRSVRQLSEDLCEPLETEDYVVQSMTEASPTRWHLAHSSWFFERFVLVDQFDADFVDERYDYLFNSYYNAAGPQFSRPDRGLLTRPTVEEIREYRARIDSRMSEVLGSAQSLDPDVARTVEVGLHHEQQHQELMVTDVKHMFGQNPLHPEVLDVEMEADETAPPLEWVAFDGGLVEIGHDGDGFAFDNESPRHEVRLEPFELANRPVTCGEFIEFIEDGAYDRPDPWLSDGWQTVQEEGWDSPLYWERDEGEWKIYDYGGLRAVDPAEPLCHVSYYEADAFARWAGARLPTEEEWEHAAGRIPVDGRFLDLDRRHPRPAREPEGDRALLQMFGDVWEWTASPFTGYPGFEPFEGAIGEYTGKFMCNQMVLRGGSCATPPSHIRRTYRNFFYPDARWQFAGLRLARGA